MKLAGFFFLLLVAACHRNEEKKETVITNETAEVKVEKPVQKPVEAKPKVTKILREAVYFSASLEREGLKLLMKDNSFQKNTLFSVLSYILETSSGVRKSTPLGLDCGKFELQFLNDQISIAKACLKPAREIARITTITLDREFEILFKANEWGRVLGMSAVLTGSDIKCRLSLVEQKLTMLNCQNWFYQVNEDQLSATVIKADEFLFQRSAEKQFVIRGGFYKELIQNKKIDIVVPLEGKIKIIEKEIKVIDEFADQKDGVINEKKERFEVKPAKEKSDESQAVESKSVEAGQEQNPEQGPEQSQGQNSQTVETQEQTNGETPNPETQGVSESIQQQPAPVPTRSGRGR
jgi:hypothetical protein